MANLNCKIPSANDVGNGVKTGAQSLNVLNAVAIPASIVGGVAGGAQDVVVNLTLVVWRGVLNSAAAVVRPFNTGWRANSPGTLSSLQANQWSHAGQYAQGTWAAVMPTDSSTLAPVNTTTSVTQEPESSTENSASNSRVVTGSSLEVSDDPDATLAAATNVTAAAAATNVTAAATNVTAVATSVTTQAEEKSLEDSDEHSDSDESDHSLNNDPGA